MKAALPSMRIPVFVFSGMGGEEGLENGFTRNGM
jgi:hypothetical protein